MNIIKNIGEIYSSESVENIKYIRILEEIIF
jgi:hypothetical protein